ncbi:hypothetical protein CDAR_270271 [Caerostris darwini]|uniref:Uncharacterized protein n=1 Tax=Caerostris darwini TaxID=1538125 RepID=A0AAV4NKH9_9ARAC|nr:hypothetical protein CDAR_270271 [Caerostris darwini]
MLADEFAFNDFKLPVHTGSPGSTIVYEDVGEAGIATESGTFAVFRQEPFPDEEHLDVSIRPSNSIFKASSRSHPIVVVVVLSFNGVNWPIFWPLTQEGKTHKGS